ncbi:MAG: histidinol-phosphatase HisJ family protein [Lachnospiraceae bacterium]|nr:histidinol-phosphatase HisJ family protein [Lachnospiraceae bacterium]
MPIRADYHLHSHFSGDCDASMEEMILKAISLNFTHMCFTEHFDLDYPVSEDTPAGMFDLNVDSYLFDLIKYKEKYADQIQVNFGIELGMQPHLSRENARIVKAHEFDFVIASTHLVQGRDPYFPNSFLHMSDEELYRCYFEEELACIRSFTNFDVYGHIDYVIRYGKKKDKDYSYEKYQDLFDKMIDTLLYQEKGIEINTGGLRKGLNEPNPCSEFLRRYRKKGGEIITVGSDAHFVQHLGADFDRAAEILKDCGFKYYCTFEKRTPSFHKL